MGTYKNKRLLYLSNSMHKDNLKERKDFLKNKVTPILEPLVAE